LDDFGHSGWQSAERRKNGALEGLTDRHSMVSPEFPETDTRRVRRTRRATVRKQRAAVLYKDDPEAPSLDENADRKCWCGKELSRGTQKGCIPNRFLLTKSQVVIESGTV